MHSLEILVVLAPFVTLKSPLYDKYFLQFICRQRARSRSERDRQDYASLCVPRGILRCEFRVEGYIVGTQVHGLLTLGVDPSEGLQVPEVLRVWHLMWHCDIISGSDLRNQYNRSDFLDLRVVSRRDSIEVAHNLGFEISNCYEFLENVFG